MRIRYRANRAGFTLAEVLLAMALFGGLVAVTLKVLNQQVRTFYNGSNEADAAQNLRFTLSVLEKHASNVGAGVPGGQPQFVYGDSMLIALNADWMSRIPGDQFAVNVDTTMPLLAVTALTKARRFTFPGTSFAYPDTNYNVGAQNSPAETILFWFALDGSTPDPNDYILWRQVNDQQSEIVARGLLRPSTGRFFRYLRHTTPVSGSARMDSVPTSWLPLRHLRPIHAAKDDTATFARIDSVRAIQVAFRATDGMPAPKTRTWELSRVITLPNAGKDVERTCGDDPILQSGVNFTAMDTVDAFGTHSTILRWNASVDEATGEKDVVEYVLWRSNTSFIMSALGDPYISVPAGNTSYEYIDGAVLPLTPYYYALGAQDCTPKLSNIRALTTPVMF
jgi:prepilin-type N-terminal cleavage/methylation domain-containing protein